LNKTNCEDILGIELNTDGFRHCYSLSWVMTINEVEFGKLNNTEVKS